MNIVITNGYGMTQKADREQIKTGLLEVVFLQEKIDKIFCRAQQVKCNCNEYNKVQLYHQIFD